MNQATRTHQGEPTGKGRYARRAAPTKRNDAAMLIELPKALRTALDEEATRRGFDSRAELVRQACAAFIGKPTAA